jgi:hypothetical protein
LGLCATNLDKFNIDSEISFNKQITYKEWLSSLNVERLINAKAKLLEEKSLMFRFKQVCIIVKQGDFKFITN